MKMSSKYSRFSSNNLLYSNKIISPIDDTTVPEFLWLAYQLNDPKTIFLDDPKTHEKLTYGEFMDKVQSVALAFVDLGITRDDMIMFFDDNSFSYAISYFAALFVGIPLWQLSPPNNSFEVAQRITNVPDKTVVLIYGTSRRNVIKKMHEQFEDLVHDRIKLEIEMDSLNVQENTDEEGQCDLRISHLITKFAASKLQSIPYYPVEDVKTQAATIVCTSGTTGQPKGAIHSHYSMTNSLNILSTQMNPIPGDKALLFFAIGHISGAMFLPVQFIQGKTVCLTSNITTEDFVKIVQNEGINQTLVTPSIIYELATGNFEEFYDLSSLKVIYTGGTTISAAFGDKLREKLPNILLMNFYGMTEYLFPVFPFIPDLANTLTHVGTVCPGSILKIACLETGKALGLNESGEICCKGASRFKGYYRNPEATASAIDSDGFYHSGDVGYLDENLCLHINDRVKEMIKVFSSSVYPTEIEQFIQYKFPQVSAACVVGKSLPSGDAYLRAYITLQEDSLLDTKLIEKEINDNFADFKRLKDGIQIIEDMPRTIIGKIDRQHFKRLVENGG